jgi:hypothetical protein
MLRNAPPLAAWCAGKEESRVPVLRCIAEEALHRALDTKSLN